MKKGNLVKNLKEAKKDVWKRMISYIGAGLGLVIGLAWNDAVTLFIAKLFPNSTNTIVAKFVYAIMLTAIIGSALFYAEKVLNKKEES